MKPHLRTLFTASISFFVLMVLFSSVTLAAQPHTPKFTWQVLGGAVNPEQWICDGDIPLALFEQRIIEQPAENLMFFNGVPKPPVLRHVRLTPDGPPLVECIQLYWKLHNSLATDCMVNIDVQGSGTDKLVVTFHTRDRSGIADSKRILTLTFDSSTGSYVYDFQAFITFNSPDFLTGPCHLEFSDPWFVGCPGPAVEFPGMWDRRYQKFVYESDNGLVAIPINHYITTLKSGIKMKRDGMFFAAYEPDGNPAIQFMGDTAGNSDISICWWGYDFHLARTITPEEMDNPVLAHFRITNCPASGARTMVRDAKLPEWKPLNLTFNEYPIYERNSSFEKGLAIDGVYEGKVDPFAWIPVGDGAVWDKTSGRTDSYSLKIEKSGKGRTSWQTYKGDGEGYFAEPWPFIKGYKVSCWVKTEGVSGRGSSLAIKYHVPNFAQEYPVYTARKLTGANGWTKMELEVGPPPEKAGCLMILLLQDGSGTTWFDDLEVTPIK